MINKLPIKLQQVLDNLVKHKATPVIVGGSVRDYFFNKNCTDYDIEVYGLESIEKFKKLLGYYGEVNEVGKSFGILKLNYDGDIYDFSFPRIENKIGIGHKAFDIIIDSNLPYTKAAKRRDFTINSIGYDYKNNIFLDPFNGREDIKNKILRYIDKQSFIEDPLRVYRAVQLCGRFNLTIEENTKNICIMMVQKSEFKTISLDRIYEEYKKLLLQSEIPSKGLYLLNIFNICCLSDELIQNIDDMVKYKTKNLKDNMLLMFYFLFDILEEISNDKKLYKDIKKLKEFKVPKIYAYKIQEIKNKAEYISIKYHILQSMPQPYIFGKDLINLGYKPSVAFGKVLDRLYEMQLNGEVKSKKEAENLISTLLNNN